jgi:hypothetical protein
MRGASHLEELANTCPLHGVRGYFLIDSPERYIVLRGLFRMAAGASGFCPQCLKSYLNLKRHVEKPREI